MHRGPEPPEAFIRLFTAITEQAIADIEAEPDGPMQTPLKRVSLPTKYKENFRGHTPQKVDG